MATSGNHQPPPLGIRLAAPPASAKLKRCKACWLRFTEEDDGFCSALCREMGPDEEMAAIERELAAEKGV